MSRRLFSPSFQLPNGLWVAVSDKVSCGLDTARCRMVFADGSAVLIHGDGRPTEIWFRGGGGIKVSVDQDADPFVVCDGEHLFGDIRVVWCGQGLADWRYSILTFPDEDGMSGKDSTGIICHFTGKHGAVGIERVTRGA